jgi:hypothetical protein
VSSPARRANDVAAHVNCSSYWSDLCDALGGIGLATPRAVAAIRSAFEQGNVRAAIPLTMLDPRNGVVALVAALRMTFDGRGCCAEALLGALKSHASLATESLADLEEIRHRVKTDLGTTEALDETISAIRVARSKR